MFTIKLKKIVFKMVVLSIAILLIFQNSIFQIGHVLAAVDIEKPVLKGITLESQEATLGDTVKISLEAEDDESGINSVSIFYQTPITEKQQHFILKYNHDNGKYETTIDITDWVENGT